MATFKVVVRKKRADGFYPVYIRGYVCSPIIFCFDKMS